MSQSRNDNDNHEKSERRRSWFQVKRPVVTSEEYIELKRSRVRRMISYAALTFVFLGGGILIGILMLHFNDKSGAINVFNTILPIASGVIGYWFAEKQYAKNGNGPSS